MSGAKQNASQLRMSDREFERLSSYIYSECGINITHSKKTMLEARLSKRLKQLGIESYRDYCNYLFGRHDEDEVVHMIDIVTTNKTEFFREPAHFDYLARTAAGELMKKHGAGIERELRVWSAGCSTGEEPYTLSIVLSEICATRQRCAFSVLATDISTRVLQAAVKGIYEQEKIRHVPDHLKRKYFLRGKGEYSGLVRISPDIRNKVEYRRLNLMEGDFGIRERMDIIFCRNVIIYFDRATQEKLLGHFCERLVPGGYIFMGHSETLHGMALPLANAAPTVYRKK